MDDLIGEFLTETQEFTAELDNQLVELEQDPDNQTIIGSIFRIVHTIKGTCGFLGFDKMEKVAHSAENLLGKFRDGVIKVSPDKITLIFKVVDVIKQIVDHLEESGKEPDIDSSDLINKLNKIANGEEVELTDANNLDLDSILPDAQKQENDENSTVNSAKTMEPLESAEEMEIKERIAENSEDKNFEMANANLEQIDNANQDSLKENEVVEYEKIADEGIEKHTTVEEKTHELGTEVEGKPVVVSQGNKIQKLAKPKAKNSEKSEDGSTVSEGHKTQQTIRVSLDLLEGLMQEVSELVLTRNQLIQIARTNKDNEFAMPLQRLSHITSELQERVMKTRMQPIGNAWSQFPRMIRDLSQELNKKIKLELIGEDTELDRQLIESIKDPLTHMIRNSCDHGLEIGEERLKAGKNEMGKVTLKAFHQGGHIIIKVSDDGRGLNIVKIKEKILQKGLATENELEQLTNQQIFQYIFKAGFSTAESITSVSGRGVGMDVVKNNIEKISGTVEMNSEEGKGTSFIVKIPLTLAIMPILIVEIKGGKFGIPQISILEMVKAGPDCEHGIEKVNNRLLLRLRNSLLPLLSLQEILHPGEQAPDVENNNYFIVVCEVGNFNFGIMVDKIYDTEEIVVKPVAPILRSIDIYSGSTLLGDGNVIMILDPNGLMKHIGSNVRNNESTAGRNADESKLEEKQIANMLVFKAGDGALKVVPLDVVSRLEEIDPKQVEISIDKMVVQYRNSLMHLTKINDSYEITKKNLQQLIVFSDENKILGIMVEEIVDIVEADVGNMVASRDKKGFIGSIVINNKTMDILDLNHFFHNVFQQNFDTKEETNITDTKQIPQILLVDDSAFFRKFIPPLFKKIGFNSLVADSVNKAQEILESSHNIKVIVTDLNMPGMNGAEFAINCKNNPVTENIPIIVLTSNASEEFISNINDYGIDAYASKTNYEDLLDIIRKFTSVESK